jgi:hypothetical protein
MADEDIREGEPPHQRDAPDHDDDQDDWRLQHIRKQSEEDDFVKQFHEQMVALGVLWILVPGLISGAMAFFAIEFAVGHGRDFSFLAIHAAITSGIWVVLGVFVCLKQVWAVHVGLMLSYLTIVISIVGVFTGTPEGFGGCLCSFTAIGVSILQAHRVIGWAKKMHAAGIPLDRKRD